MTRALAMQLDELCLRKWLNLAGQFQEHVIYRTRYWTWQYLPLGFLGRFYFLLLCSWGLLNVCCGGSSALARGCGIVGLGMDTIWEPERGKEESTLPACFVSPLSCLPSAISDWSYRLLWSVPFPWPTLRLTQYLFICWVLLRIIAVISKWRLRTWPWL